MRIAALGAIVAIAALAGCSSGRALLASAELPAAARAAPQSYVVVTVRNPVSLPVTRAASTPRGYDGVGVYSAGAVARNRSRALAADYHLREVSSWPIALLGVHCLVYALPTQADPALLLSVIARDPRVESAQPLLTFGTVSSGYNDPYSTLQRNVEQMSVAEAQEWSRGASVRVAVIDTGAAVDHPDLPARILTRNFVDNDARSFLEDTHGTAVAGVIAAVPNNGVGIVGIAPDVKLLLFKACWRVALTGAKAACNSFTLAQALSAAIEDHADIINLSLAGPSDPLLTRLVGRAVDAGIIVVGAVPADGLRNSFPTNIGAVIAVDSIESGHADPRVLRAPGRDVISLAPDGHYDFYSGSSLATAEVSGLIALLRAQRPHLSAHEAEALLAGSAGAPAGDSAAAAPNACAALATMLNRPRCTDH
ncbi:MAG: S8 family serine peptidase [Steroidobacteraceae bacterium]